MNWLDEVLGFLVPRKRSLFGRWADRLLEAYGEATGSLERTTSRAVGAAGEARRRTGAQLREVGERARAGARARRDELADRVDAIARRAAEIQEGRERHRQERRERRQQMRRRPRPGRAAPMQLDLRRDDRIVLRGRRPINVRMSDGGVIRYRYYERPGFWRRFYLHLTGRKVWPRR